MGLTVSGVGEATGIPDFVEVDLGRASSIAEMAAGPPVPVRLAAEMAETSTPIKPGTTSVTVTIQVVFELGE